MTNNTDIARTLIESKQYHIDDAITPQLIIDAIAAMPSCSNEDANRIIQALIDTFPTLEI